MRRQEQEINIGIAYILWALGIFGFCGIHRLYLGRIGTGILYFFTFGLFGLGQIVDLFLIPDMVREKNYYLQEKAKANNLLLWTDMGEEIIRSKASSLLKQMQTNANSSPARPNKSDPMLKLLKAAADNNNVLSIGQAVIILELPVEQVEKLLQKALKQGLAHIDNDLETGAVRYHFDI